VLRLARSNIYDFYVIYGSSVLLEDHSRLPSGSLDPLGSLGTAVWSFYMHGFSDPLETGSDGPCGFSDSLGSRGFLSLADIRGYFYPSVYLFLWFLLVSRMALQ
jgi:hypothetical protein